MKCFLGYPGIFKHLIIHKPLPKYFDSLHCIRPMRLIHFVMLDLNPWFTLMIEEQTECSLLATLISFTRCAKIFFMRFRSNGGHYSAMKRVYRVTDILKNVFVYTTDPLALSVNQWNRSSIEMVDRTISCARFEPLVVLCT